MAILERFQNVIGRASGEHSRFYGPGRALAGAVAASLAWLAVFAVTRVPPEPASPTAALQEDDQTLQQEAFLQLSPDAPDDFSLIQTPPFISEIAPVDGTLQALLPLEERDDYRVAPPDILEIEVICDEPVEGSRLEEFSGERRVSPDGTIRLADQCEPVSVADKTLPEIKAAIEDALEPEYRNVTALVSVFAQNSHVYYVIVESGDSSGDSVQRFPAVGNETVLDVISQINGLSELANKKIWIARPSPSGAGRDRILPVNWEEISQDNTTADNPPILPGDRIFITDGSEPGLLPPASETDHSPATDGIDEPQTDE
jgi:protein involved in polysaccharide export with SLBB domain